MRLRYILLVLLTTTSAWGAMSEACNRSCPAYLEGTLPYPFGTSENCEIQISCDESGARVGDFSIETITSGYMRIRHPGRCGRSVESIQQLYSPNFAPNWRNMLVLGMCPAAAAVTVTDSRCVLPHYYKPWDDCGLMLNCYEQRTAADAQSTYLDHGYLNMEKLNQTKCKYFIDSIAVSNSGTLGGVLSESSYFRVEWWLNGPCQCAGKATCSQFEAPGGGTAHRCFCRKENLLHGDGYHSCKGMVAVFSNCEVFASYGDCV